MEKDNKEKLIIPKHVQKSMMEFFLRTSIPRKIKLEKEQKKAQEECKNPLPIENGKED